MKQTGDLLAIRRIRKAKKPRFIRQDAHKKAKLEKKWIRPKGSDSKMRQGFRGYRRSVTKGWKSPLAVRGLSRNGLRIVYVENELHIKGVDKDKECIEISSSVGLKKKTSILKAAIENGITVLNVKDPKGFIEKVEKELAEKKEKKTKDLKEKEKKEKEKEAAAKKKEEQEKNEEDKGKEKTLDELTKEDEKKKEEEKKEKDKLLIKKNQIM
ncbi:hypothetical protein JXB31_02740 [Candidatus Woesearchaeota archaeon]|nr:hypothetical protein [Candidatus Woesearchaeota archaeon]